MNIKNAFLFLPLLASVDSFASFDNYRDFNDDQSSSGTSVVSSGFDDHKSSRCPMSICSRGTDSSMAIAFGGLNINHEAMSVCSGWTDSSITKNLQNLNLRDSVGPVEVPKDPRKTPVMQQSNNTNFVSPVRPSSVSHQSPGVEKNRSRETLPLVLPKKLDFGEDSGSSCDELFEILGNVGLGGRLSSSSDEISNSDNSLVEDGRPQRDILAESTSGDGSPRDVPATPAVIKGLGEDSLSSRKRRKVN